MAKDEAVARTGAGAPLTSNEHSLTVGPDGPILLQDHALLEKMAHFNRERVPERVVHAKGGGARGSFEVTGDVSAWCRADFLRSGTKTDVLARFSTVAGEQGSADTVRDPRGFAIKFYTEEGNYDLVGNNTPVFFIRDPQKFSDFIHSQKRRGDTHLRDHNMQWDFWTLSPESAHQVIFLMGDRGIPKTWRHMDGFSSHTFLWQNAGGHRFWVKYHFKTDQGNEFFTDDDAKAQAAEDPDYHLRDLHEAIAHDDPPSWTLSVQVMEFEEAADYRFNPFDLTKVWPHGDYPLHEVGRLILNQNHANYFAEIEQAAFEPANFVPGIGPSPDRMLLGRLFSYPDTHRHRIGVNYLQLPVNAPKPKVRNYNPDGAMTYVNQADPLYAPNSYGGPLPHKDGTEASWGVAGEIMRAAASKHRDDDDFVQAGDLYRKVLYDASRDRLVATIAAHLREGVEEPVIERALDYWRHVDEELGVRLAVEMHQKSEDPAPTEA